MKKDKLIRMGSLLFLVTFLFSGCVSPVDLLREDAALCVVYTDMVASKGKCFLLDEKGERLEEENLPMQDLSRYCVTEEAVILSGHRKNNSVIFTKGNAAMDKSFLFLNESKYTGVMALQWKEDTVLGVMNGNFREDGVYLNLLVRQSLRGEILQRTVLETYTHALLSEGEQAVVAGHYLNAASDERQAAQILICSLNEGAAQKSYQYEEYNCFWDIVRVGDEYVCVTEDKDQRVNTLLSIDADTFEVEKTTVFSDQLSSLIMIENALYAVGDQAIYGVDPQTLEYTVKFHFEQGNYTDFAYLLDGKLCAFSRFDQRVLNHNTYEYGYFYEIDADTFEYRRTLITSKRWEAMNCIFILPSSFFRGEG